MKIVLILLPLLVNAQYKIEEISNPLLPVQEGPSYIITNYHHVYYHINLTNIRQSLILTEKTLLQVNQTIDKVQKPMYNLLVTRISDLLNQVYSIKDFITHYKTKRRTKRGLFNFLGKAQKYLYGTLDADDGERYDNYIKIIQENQNTLHDDISSTQTIVKQLIKDVDTQLSNIKSNQQKLQDRVNDLTQMTQSTSTTMYLVILLDNLENNIHILNEIRNNVQTAINFAEINVLHHSILKYKELRAIIHKLKPETRIPFDNLIKYYETAHTDVTIKNDLIIFYIAIPLISGKPYTLYRVYPIPINNQIITLTNPYLLKSSNDFYNLKEKCPKIEKISLCLEEVLNSNEPCVMKSINLTNHCPMVPINFKKTSVTQLEDNSIIIIPTQSENIQFQCPNQKSIEIINQPSLILPSECSTKIKDKIYESQNPEIISSRLKLPTIVIDEKLVQEIEPLQLTEINLDKIHEDLERAKQLTVHHLKKFDVVSSSVSIILILVIIFIIIGIVIYFYYRKNKDNVKVDIQLETLENVPRFSQS